MEALNIFFLQFFSSTVLFIIIARWYAKPWLAKKKKHEALILLILPHAFRFFGMTFLVSNVVSPGLPIEFASPAAYGDLIAALFAFIAIIALHKKWGIDILFAWLFSFVSIIDFAYAITTGLRLNVLESLGGTWFIPTLFVPFLLVTNFMVFQRLVKGGK